VGRNEIEIRKVDSQEVENAPRIYATPTVTTKFSLRGLGISSGGRGCHVSLSPANGAMIAAICEGGTSLRSRIGDTRGAVLVVVAMLGNACFFLERT
jgi:hypothetical protein